MKSFFGFFRAEAKRIIFSKKVLMFFLILVVSFYFVIDGIKSYSEKLESKKIFQKVELSNIESFQNYNQFGAFGFRLTFIPSPLAILFSNSNILYSPTAMVDSGVRVRIYKSYLGQNLYSEQKYRFVDFFRFCQPNNYYWISCLWILFYPGRGIN